MAFLRFPPMLCLMFSTDNAMVKRKYDKTTNNGV